MEVIDGLFLKGWGLFVTGMKAIWSAGQATPSALVVISKGLRMVFFEAILPAIL